MPWPRVVNCPMELAASGVAARVRISAVPSGPGAGIVQTPAVMFASVYDPQDLTFHDAADLAGANADNVVWSAPKSALAVGTTIDLTTTTGLVAKSVPLGVAAYVEFA